MPERRSPVRRAQGVHGRPDRWSPGGIVTYGEDASTTSSPSWPPTITGRSAKCSTSSTPPGRASSAPSTSLASGVEGVRVWPFRRGDDESLDGGRPGSIGPAATEWQQRPPMPIVPASRPRGRLRLRAATCHPRRDRRFSHRSATSSCRTPRPASVGLAAPAQHSSCSGFPSSDRSHRHPVRVVTAVTTAEAGGPLPRPIDAVRTSPAVLTNGPAKAHLTRHERALIESHPRRTSPPVRRPRSSRRMSADNVRETKPATPDTELKPTPTSTLRVHRSCRLVTQRSLVDETPSSPPVTPRHRRQARPRSATGRPIARLGRRHRRGSSTPPPAGPRGSVSRCIRGPVVRRDRRTECTGERRARCARRRRPCPRSPSTPAAIDRSRRPATPAPAVGRSADPRAIAAESPTRRRRRGTGRTARGRRRRSSVELPLAGREPLGAAPTDAGASAQRGRVPAVTTSARRRACRRDAPSIGAPLEGGSPGRCVQTDSPTPTSPAAPHRPTQRSRRSVRRPPRRTVRGRRTAPPAPADTSTAPTDRGGRRAAVGEPSPGRRPPPSSARSEPPTRPWVGAVAAPIRRRAALIGARRTSSPPSRRVGTGRPTRRPVRSSPAGSRRRPIRADRRATTEHRRRRHVDAGGRAARGAAALDDGRRSRRSHRTRRSCDIGADRERSVDRPQPSAPRRQPVRPRCSGAVTVGAGAAGAAACSAPSPRRRRRRLRPRRAVDASSALARSATLGRSRSPTGRRSRRRRAASRMRARLGTPGRPTRRLRRTESRAVCGRHAAPATTDGDDDVGDRNGRPGRTGGAEGAAIGSRGAGAVPGAVPAAAPPALPRPAARPRARRLPHRHPLLRRSTPMPIAEPADTAVSVYFEVRVDGHELGAFTGCDGLGCRGRHRAARGGRSQLVRPPAPGPHQVHQRQADPAGQRRHGQDRHLVRVDERHRCKRTQAQIIVKNHDDNAGVHVDARRASSPCAGRARRCRSTRRRSRPRRWSSPTTASSSREAAEMAAGHDQVRQGPARPARAGRRTKKHFKPGSSLKVLRVRLQPEGLQHVAAGGLELQAAEEARASTRSSPAPSCARSTSRCSSTPPTRTTATCRRSVDDAALDGAADRQVDQRRARRSRRSSCSRGGRRQPFVGVVKSVTSTLTLFRPSGQPVRATCKVSMQEYPTRTRAGRTRRRARCAAPAPTASCSATRWPRSPTPSTARRRCGGRSPTANELEDPFNLRVGTRAAASHRPPTPPSWPEPWPRNARPTSSRSRSTATPLAAGDRRRRSSRRSSRTRSTCPTRSSWCSATRCARCSRPAGSRSARRLSIAVVLGGVAARACRSSTARSPPSRPRSSATRR